MLTVILAVLLDTNDVVAEAGDAMDVDVILMRSSEGASRDSGRNGHSVFVCWFYEKRQCGKFGLGVRSREASFEVSKRSLAETRCVDTMTVDLNALEIGAVLLPVRNHEIQVGIDSSVAVIVFVHFCWFVMKGCKSCVDLSARKVKGKLRGVTFWCAMRSVGGSVRERHESRCVLLLSR